MNLPSWQISASARQVSNGLWMGDFVPTFGLTDPQNAPFSTKTKSKINVASAACQPCPLHAAGAPSKSVCHASVRNPLVHVNIQQWVSLFIFLGDLVAEAGQTSPHLGITQR